MRAVFELNVVVSARNHCPSCGARGLSRSRKKFLDRYLERFFGMLPYRCASCGARRYINGDGVPLRSRMGWAALIILVVLILLLLALPTLSGLMSKPEQKTPVRYSSTPTATTTEEQVSVIEPNAQRRFASESVAKEPSNPTFKKKEAVVSKKESAKPPPRQVKPVNKPSQNKKPINSKPATEKKPVRLYRLEDIIGEYDGYISRVGVFASKRVDQHKLLSQTSKQIDIFLGGRWTLPSSIPRSYPIADPLVSHVGLKPVKDGLRVTLFLTGPKIGKPTLLPFNGGLIVTVTPAR